MKKTSKLSAIFYKVRFKYKLLFCFFLFYIGLLLLVLLLFNHYTIKAKEIELKKQIDLSHSALKFHFEDMKESRYNFIQSYSKHLDLLKSNYFLRKESIVKMSRHLLENYELNDKFKTFHSINELNAIQTLHYSPFIDQMTPNDISSQYIIPMDSSNEGHLTLLMGSVKKINGTLY